ncbi:disintegrin and metalloproteinase domain-containing protein 12-like isoform X3 [Stegodyphus dumicola]|uniref:disintegrin and metalloproteinase domain-containing protein 12-like isoform X3 n=1 Tax=Stegodyphus dumicola TaxID=202533 RepID=UPI0015B08668|nr:disintegrin and metalloproteinase domain-containing protein 12-like isoform X3 [Stegodyphus dumicola]
MRIEQFKEFNEDKNAVFERSKEIANIVNGLYSPLNVYIALVGVIVWSDHDEIKLSPDGDATLTNFLHYRRERLAQEHPNDNAQLITAMTFDGGVVGKALKGPICTYEYSGGVNMDHSHVVGLVATTVSHELGHNFGMEHDTDECQCPDDKCIMSPSSSSTSPRRWSSCSLEYLELAYSQGMDYCLKNRPTDIIGPVCGNGFLEEGEECDCGLKEFCSNHCCNATTCELYSNATCAVGGCCDTETCQVKKVATLCRDSASECDLPEFCDGVSEFCPSDIFRQNGEECGNGKAYCYDGRCQSHLDQCRLLWGQTGKMSDLRCYEQNYKGNVNGNCGYNRINSTYKACRKDDILCGMLHCTHLNERLEFGMESAAILARSFINVRGKIFTCRSAIVDLGLFNTDPGLAPNGAKCGEGKACVNQKCVPVSSMRKNDCPYDCSGNGVCNSRGNCHCELGYAPPYCDSPGPGGSIDSGPASDPSSYFIVIAMYVIFLGLLPLMVLASAGIYYYRNHLKNWWSRKAHKANIKSRAKTTTQRKLQPPSKFQFDRNSIRTLEISAPLPVSSSVNCAVSTLPAQTSHNLADSSGFSEVQISSPVPQNSGTLQSNKFTPVRPAPPRPDNTPQRTPSWTPATAVITPTIVRTSSLRSPCESNVGNRPLSTSGFRPTCPPPRPPPPKLNSSSLLQQDLSSYTYEDIPKSKEHERSVTPSSIYYDDCQTLDFTDTPLAFVHMSKQNNVKDSKINDVSYHKQNNCAASEHISTDVNKINNRTNKTFNINNQSVGACKPVFPRVVRTGETSLVASLAQKFEKQDSSNTCDSLSNSLRPPFKSRPLPPRPDNPRA